MLLHDEIAEQPAIIRRLLAEGSADARRIGRLLAPADHLTIAARGSSDNAATFGKYLFEGVTGIVTALAAPSTVTLYRSGPSFARGAVIGISQSGAAPDVAAVLGAARAEGVPAIALTNAARSRVARASATTFRLRAGRERSIAATKTFTATCVALAMIAAACAEARDRAVFPFAGLPEAAEDAVAAERDAVRLARRIGDVTALVVVGRGFAYAAALETALKIKELARVWAEPYSGADLAHGPVALLGRGTRVLVLAARGATARGARALARRSAARGARVFAITDDPALARDVDDAVLLRSRVAEPLAGIPLVIAAQHLAAEMSRLRGLDPDRPAGLTKVTRTR